MKKKVFLFSLILFAFLVFLSIAYPVMAQENNCSKGEIKVAA